MCVSLTGKALRLRRPSRIRRALLPALGGGIAAYGAIAFIRRELLAYMLVRTQFVFWISASLLRCFISIIWP